MIDIDTLEKILKVCEISLETTQKIHMFGSNNPWNEKENLMQQLKTVVLKFIPGLT